MPRAIAIRILERDNNRRGDLFGRLMSDLFLSLGYDDVRLNIARSGREIDIEAEHRVERRLAMAECKALKAKAGGKEINAFAGKLRPERRKRPGGSITPHFISLSGFTETSVDQEDESGEDAIILIDGSRIAKLNRAVSGAAPRERESSVPGGCSCSPCPRQLPCRRGAGHARHAPTGAAGIDFLWPLCGEGTVHPSPQPRQIRPNAPR